MGIIGSNICTNVYANRIITIFTQAAYRIADSVTNAVSPLEPFMPFIITCGQRYDDDVGLGTVISIMLPYAIAFLVSWTMLLIVWYVFNIPLGPGATIGM